MGKGDYPPGRCTARHDPRPRLGLCKPLSSQVFDLTRVRYALRCETILHTRTIYTSVRPMENAIGEELFSDHDGVAVDTLRIITHYIMNALY